MRTFGRSLEIVLVSLLTLGMAYWGMSYVVGAIGNSMLRSANMIEEAGR